MVTKEQEYKAELLKIGGFALMTPLAKLFLELPYLKLEDPNLLFIIFIPIAFLSFYFGIIFLLRGTEMVTEKRK